jgi:hypothetical protein
MLSQNSYSRDYIAGCRAKIDAHLAAYRALAATGGPAAVAAFEPLYLGTLVTLLDGYFVHRMRAMEGKDGNPLNEVRLLCASIMTNDGVLISDKTIKLKPQTSVLGLKPGDPVALRELEFVRLADAFFADIEQRYADA